MSDEKLKYNLIASSVPPIVANRIADLITEPPLVEPFSKLKERFLSAFELTDAAKFARLMEGCELGDRKPSEILAELCTYAQDQIAETTLGECFLRRLPGDNGRLLPIKNTRENSKSRDSIVEMKGGPNICGIYDRRTEIRTSTIVEIYEKSQ